VLLGHYNAICGQQWTVRPALPLRSACYGTLVGCRDCKAACNTVRCLLANPLPSLYHLPQRYLLAVLLRVRLLDWLQTITACMRRPCARSYRSMQHGVGQRLAAQPLAQLQGNTEQYMDAHARKTRCGCGLRSPGDHAAGDGAFLGFMLPARQAGGAGTVLSYRTRQLGTIISSTCSLCLHGAPAAAASQRVPAHGMHGSTGSE
jgi:hypothetical protein